MLDETVVEMRRLVRDEKWRIEDCAKHFRVGHKRVAQAIRGTTHSHLPDPIPVRTLYSDEEVLEMRRLCHEDGLTQQTIADKFGITYRLANAIISGRQYKNLPGAVNMDRRCLTDVQVTEARRLYRDEGWSQYAVAAYFEVSISVASQAVRGSSYKHLTGAHRKPIGSLTDERAMEIRTFARDNPEWTTNRVSDRFQIRRGVGSNLLLGISYKHLPVYPRADRRRFSAVEVTEMRFLYADGYSLLDIGGFYHCNPSTVGGIVRGRFYPEVPGAVPLRKKGKPRLLTDEQVSMARRMFRTRYVSGSTIAKELGISGSIYNVLRGFSYKELPDHVP
ncbi:MAG: hypothetical protein EOO77_46565, partial [Oxalobacteraceae bacterium]